ncbi:MAG: type VI secretion system tube protein Hcp [Methylocystis sp.]|nr:MAG: type VI secretion system tube protein Hcp [Methylocystis sp.]
MALDIFLKLGDIKGESTDAGHGGEIDVLSWDWGVEQGVAAIAGGGGGTAGKPKLRNLRFAHHIDAASPFLMQACASGKHPKDAVMTVRRPGAQGIDVIAVRLSGVTVASVNAEVNGANGELFETVTLSFSKINFDYTPTTKEGDAGAPLPFAFSV